MKMKKWILRAAVGASLIAVPAIAAINPNTLSLPDAAQWGGFTNNPMTHNQASSMCVDCHGVVPFDRQSVASGGMPHTYQESYAAYTGSHYVGAATNSGGGITWAAESLAPRTGGQYFKKDAWIAAGTDGGIGPSTNDGYSKYATAAGVSEIAAGAACAVATGTTGSQVNAVPANNSHMVCESCHSVTRNVISSKKLLGSRAVASFDNANGKFDAATTGMCEGCHGDMTQAGVHGNNQPETNNHHVIGVAGFPAADVANRITDAKAAASLLWTRAALATGSDRDMSNSPVYAGEELEIKFRVRDPWVGDMVKATAAADFNCTDCHAYGHGGTSSMGARILRTGGAETGRAALGGVERLEDTAAKNMTIFTDDQPYCQACHVYQP